MTTRPRLKLGDHLLPGLVAVALFAVLAFVFLTAGFGESAGLAADGSITAGIGYALFDMTDLSAFPVERFLVAFEIIDVVLVAALVGAVMLARREEDGSIVARVTDGGRPGGESADDGGTGSDADGRDDPAADTAEAEGPTGGEA